MEIKIKQLISYFVLLLFLNGCFEHDYFYLSEHEKYLFEEGDTLIYKSNLNNFDTLVVDYYGIGSYPDRNAYPEYHEGQTVELHFLHDKPLINVYDSILALNIECGRNNYYSEDTIPEQNCSDLYNHDSLYMSVRFYISTEREIETLRWKRHPVFELTECSGDNILTINDTEYNWVYILECDETFIDSNILFKKLFFNFNYGILRYENNNSEVFEFVGKLK